MTGTGPTGNGPTGNRPTVSGPAGDEGDAAAGRLARRVLRAADRTALATLLPPDGRPYPSLVLVALDHDATPLLLISDLADHTRALGADPRVGLLFDGTAGAEEPLAAPRVGVLGRAERSAEARHRDRFLARHPSAALYAGFGDFAIWRVVVERAHLVAGFGRIRWLDAASLLCPDAAAAIAAAEPDLLAETRIDDGGWVVTGVDPDGFDLRRGGAVARGWFDPAPADPASARAALAAAGRLTGVD